MFGTCIRGDGLTGGYDMALGSRSSACHSLDHQCVPVGPSLVLVRRILHKCTQVPVMR